MKRAAVLIDNARRGYGGGEAATAAVAAAAASDNVNGQFIRIRPINDY